MQYEVTIEVGGIKADVMLNPDGKVTLVEREIAAKDMPDAVTKAFDAKYPRATTKVAEEVAKVTDGKEAFDFYEVLLVTAEKKTFEVKLTAGGTITETEEKADEKKESQKDKK